MNTDIMNILTRPLDREWSVQGLGMMRTYLSDTKRLHIWHRDLVTVGATELHDHPWDFSSYVVFGLVRQIRYGLADDLDYMVDLYRNHGALLTPNLDAAPDTSYTKQQILCGEGGGIIGEPAEVKLSEGPIETYSEGRVYEQEAHEIHKSFPLNNTVTIIARSYLEDNDHAHVYVPKGAEFVSAEPRPATRAEILYITRGVLHAYQEASP